MFWDTSAIVPHLITEPESARVADILRDDDQLVVWWATIVECESAVARREREGVVSARDGDNARRVLDRMSTIWTEITPSEECRGRASLLVRRYPLRTADAFQLAAALVWAEGRPRGHAICTLDHRFAEVARREGFALAL